MRLEGEVTPLVALTAADRSAMLALMQRHYQHVSPRQFDEDLDEKQWAIIVRQRGSAAICGFSTQMLLEAEVNGRTVQALFSGDTIVDRRHWGDPALSHLWGNLALSLIDRAPDMELYWFLISQGFRTYRFLPLFFHEFYPRHDRTTPSATRQVLDALGQAKFGGRYEAARGIVAADGEQYRLRDDLAVLPTGRLVDEHVEHFLALNPGHARGDELCCLAPLTRENFTAAAWRVIGSQRDPVEEPSCRSPRG